MLLEKVMLRGNVTLNHIKKGNVSKCGNVLILLKAILLGKVMLRGRLGLFTVGEQCAKASSCSDTGVIVCSSVAMLSSVQECVEAVLCKETLASAHHRVQGRSCPTTHHKLTILTAHICIYIHHDLTNTSLNEGVIKIFRAKNLTIFAKVFSSQNVRLSGHS